MRRGPQGTHLLAKFRMLDPHQLVTSLGERFPEYWGEGTFRNALSVARRLVECAHLQDMDPWDEETVVDWIRSLSILPSTQESYVKVFRSIVKMKEATPLELLSVDLLNQGCRVPTFQAPSLPREALEDNRLGLNHDDNMQLWLAWKTGSRWGDLLRLSLEDFIEVTPQRVIIDWGTKTKSSKRRPFRASKYAVIMGDKTSELASWLTYSQKPIRWLRTDEVTKALKRVDPTFSAHSIKAGVTEVMERAVAEGRLDMEVKSRLLKHDARNPQLETSLRYGRNRVQQAVSLMTHLATQLL